MSRVLDTPAKRTSRFDNLKREQQAATAAASPAKASVAVPEPDAPIAVAPARAAAPVADRPPRKQQAATPPAAAGQAAATSQVTLVFPIETWDLIEAIARREGVRYREVVVAVLEHTLIDDPLAASDVIGAHLSQHPDRGAMTSRNARLPAALVDRLNQLVQSIRPGRPTLERPDVIGAMLTQRGPKNEDDGVKLMAERRHAAIKALL